MFLGVLTNKLNVSFLKNKNNVKKIGEKIILIQKKIKIEFSQNEDLPILINYIYNTDTWVYATLNSIKRNIV